MSDQSVKNFSAELDNFFYHEMMVHPALFTHPAPEKMAIIGPDTNGILAEALKHARVREICCLDPHLNPPDDKRVQHFNEDTQTWLTRCPEKSYDVIIQTQTNNEEFKHFYRILEPEGILVIPCSTSLLDPTTIIALHQKLKDAGFLAFQTLNFAQPSHPTGWRLLIMAAKHSTFRLIREKEVFNRSFTTRYYNYDVHKAALALPEFVKHLYNDS